MYADTVSSNEEQEKKDLRCWQKKETEKGLKGLQRAPYLLKSSEGGVGILLK